MNKWILFLLITVTSSVFATTIEMKPRLLLEQIKATQTQEMDGDELFFDITVYRSKQPKQYIRIPASPIHWPSQTLDKLSDITLWSGSLKPDETVTLLISLMESDVMPLNPPDLIGLVRVKLKNQAGVLYSQWNIPNRSDTLGKLVLNQEKSHQFDLRGEGGGYSLFLALKH